MPDMTNVLAELVQREEDLDVASDPAQSEREGDLLEPMDGWPARAGVSTASGKWVTLYHTITGLPHVMLEHNAKDALKQRHRDPAFPAMLGKYVFNSKPTVPPQYGTFKCWLHPDTPGAKERHAMGFPICLSAHLASPYQVELHMKSKHKTSYEAMMREREDARQNATLELQQQQIAALLRLAERQAALEAGADGGSSAPSAPAPAVLTVAAEEPVKVRVDRTSTRACPVEGCGEVFTAAAPIAVSNLINRHLKAAHPPAE